MSIPAGWAEFNDATAKIRGRLVAASGTFSGTFSADEIDVVDTINIRDGAVSAHYGFSFSRGAMSASFAIPGQPHVSVVDIIVPITVETWGRETNFAEDGEATAQFYKNGTLVSTVQIHVPADHSDDMGGEMPWIETFYMSALQCIRYIDLNVSSGSQTSYMVKLINSKGYTKHNPAPGSYGGSWGIWATKLGLLGTAVVSCRKR